MTNSVIKKFKKYIIPIFLIYISIIGVYAGVKQKRNEKFFWSHGGGGASLGSSFNYIAGISHLPDDPWEPRRVKIVKQTDEFYLWIQLIINGDHQNDTNLIGANCTIQTKNSFSGHYLKFTYVEQYQFFRANFSIPLVRGKREFTLTYFIIQENMKSLISDNYSLLRISEMFYRERTYTYPAILIHWDVYWGFMGIFGGIPVGLYLVYFVIKQQIQIAKILKILNQNPHLLENQKIIENHQEMILKLRQQNQNDSPEQNGEDGKNGL